MAIALNMSAQSEDDYFVTTTGGGATQSDSVAVSTSNLTEEERFLAEHFRYLRPDEWPLGTRFMVVPASVNQYVSTFFDKETDEEVPVASIRHLILEYRGHGVSNRGRTQLYFFCAKTGREYYHEVRNLSFEAFCDKSNTGVPALAYLDDVDKARELLVGKQMWTKTDEYYIDDAASATGASSVIVEKNLPVTIEKVGVGSREFPVKIVFVDAHGNRYFQTVCMSRTNSGIRSEQLLTDHRKNAFENSFLFSPMSAEQSDRAKRRPDATTVLRQSAVKRERQGGNYKANSWVNIVGGMVTKDMTPDDVILAKGQPHRRSSYNSRNATWYYDDGTTIRFKNGLVASVKSK